MNIIKHELGYYFEIAEIHSQRFLGFLWSIQTTSESKSGFPLVGICFWRFHFLNLLDILR